MDADRVEAVKGMALGDATLRKSSNGTSINLCHGDKQFDYLRRKMVYLKGLRWNSMRRYKSKSNGGVYWMAGSKPDKSLDSVYDSLYVGGKKKVLTQAIQSLSMVGYAFWFMDDGSVRKDRRLGFNANDRVTLHLYGGMFDDIKGVVEKLKGLFGPAGLRVKGKVLDVRFSAAASRFIGGSLNRYFKIFLSYKVVDVEPRGRTYGIPGMC